VGVNGDELRLRQAIGNLLSNARSHTPPGTCITVRVAGGAAQATVEVSDTGPGIPPDMAGHVFERFFRADASRARASGGAGLGLSIVAAIAEAHGGQADLVGTSEHGTTFRVVLPSAAPGSTGEQAAEPVSNPAVR
jgi:two-component system OmpR family sensor kinase